MTSARSLGWPATLGLLVGVYVAASIAVLFRPEGEAVAVWWPAGGLAVALTALSPRRSWPLVVPAIALASGAGNVTAGRDIDLSLLFGVANAGDALAAAYVLTRRGPARLETLDDFRRLVVATLAGGLVAALGIGASVALLDAGDPVRAVWAVFASHTAATIVLAPVAIAAASRDVSVRTWELAVQSTVLLAGTVLVFAPGQDLPLTFVPLLFLVWGALRFDVRTVCWQLAAFALLNISLTLRGYGPFAGAWARDDIQGVPAAAISQGYLICAALLSLPLAVAVGQRSTLLARVRADEQLFRRNFTESLAGQLFLRPERGRLIVVDLNAAAVDILDADREQLLGRPLDEVLQHDAIHDVALGLVAGRVDGWRGQTGLGQATGRPDGRVNVALSLLSGGLEPIFSAQLQDVTREYETRRRLESAEKLTSATLDTAACVILVTDLDGTIVRVNAATTAITGHEAPDLVGRPLWETPLAPSHPSEVEALFLWPNRSGSPVTRELDAVARNGDKLRIVWNNSVVRDEDGAPAYAVMTGIDVTAERASAGLVSHLMRASISTALVGIDPAGRITVFNTGAQHLLGYEPGEVVGTRFDRLLDPHELLERTGASSPEEAWAKLVAGMDGESRTGDWTWISKGGRRRIVAMTLSLAQDAFAAQVGYLCVGRDVTEQRQTQEMLVAALEKEREAVERLRSLDEAKNEFVSTVSHELRTPVTSIVGYTEMLRDGSIVDAHPEQLPLLQTIERNGQRLIMLCNDLLMLSGLDAGSVQWERDRVDLGDLLRPVEEEVRPLLAGRSLEVSFSRPPHQVVVTGDRVQLDRVLVNLLSNAIKFTEDGGRISCRVDTDGDEALMVVSDSGIGIPEDEQEGLFQRFFRSSSAQQRAIQGTGLGLSIVNEIVSAHGGRITVDSAHLQGSTFTVRLPVARS